MNEIVGSPTEGEMKDIYIDVLNFETPEAEQEFKTKIEGLVKNPADLSLIFPKVMDYSRPYRDKVDTPDGKALTGLPDELLDSDTYNEHPELRGQMEEIIIETNRQRHLNRYPQLPVSGENWSEKFRERMEENLKLPQLEEQTIPELATQAGQESMVQVAEAQTKEMPSGRKTYIGPDYANIRNPLKLGSNEGNHIQRPGYTKGGERKINGKVMPNRPRI